MPFSFYCLLEGRHIRDHTKFSLSFLEMNKLHVLAVVNYFNENQVIFVRYKKKIICGCFCFYDDDHMFESTSLSLLVIPNFRHMWKFWLYKLRPNWLFTNMVARSQKNAVWIKKKTLFDAQFLLGTLI